MKNVNRQAAFWLPANWSVPEWVQAGTTLRSTGSSNSPYDGFNLAKHVGDDDRHVTSNRLQLKKALCLPAEPIWLNQVHGNRVIKAGTGANKAADGIYTASRDVICAVLTADCVPLLLCNKNGTEIAAVHIGWRGLTKNIIRNAIDHFSDKPGSIIAWIGPHISSENYEVGNEVRKACESSINNAENAFVQSRPGRWFANLEQMVILELEANGIDTIYTNQFCTYRDKSMFFSYRRNKVTGRMVSMIWIDSIQS